MSKKIIAAVIAGLTLVTCHKKVDEPNIPIPTVETTQENTEELKKKELERQFNEKFEETKKKHGKRIKKETGDFMNNLHKMINSRQPKWVLENNLSNHPAYDGQPSINNQGQIAFASKRTGNLEIWLADPKSKQLIQITKNKGRNTAPVIGEDFIVFTSELKNKQDVYGFVISDKQLINISNHKSSDSQPSVSTNGKRVSFVGTRNDRLQLMSGTYTKLKSLNFDSPVAMNPSVANDGRIAFEALDKNGRREVYLVDDDGKVRNISNHPEEDYNPRISSYGRRIVFESLRDNHNSVFVYDTALRQLKKIAGHASTPVISGKGDVIAYQKNFKDGKSEICAVKLDEKLEVVSSTNLSYNRANDTNPAISPDGKTLAFVSDRDGNQEVFSIGIENLLK